MSDARTVLLRHAPTRERDALLAVLDLHQPYDDEYGSCCFGCDGGHRTAEWPCATVQAINKSLGCPND